MKVELKNILIWSISVFVLILLISVGTKKQDDRLIVDLRIDIEEQGGVYFIDQNEVLEALNGANTDYVLSLTLESLDLKMLESRLEQHPFIKQAQVYVDITGIMQVNVVQEQPILRLQYQSGKGQYVNDEGLLLPLNNKYTARLPIVTIANRKWKSSVYEDHIGSDLMQLMDYIGKDDFWKAQIAQIHLNQKNEIIMIPQVTKQEIRFGYPEDIEEKFKKLKIFYKDILPRKGWNYYSYVDVKYKNQIVCE